MSNYRKDITHARKVSGFAFWKFLPLILAGFLVITIFGWGLNALGLIGGTIVERKVFEESYQRSEALISAIAVDEAALAEIETRLSGNLTQEMRNDLEAQAAAIRVRIAANRSKQ